MDAVAAWVLSSLLVVLISVGVCWWALHHATPITPSSTPPNPFGGLDAVLFLVFGMLGACAYLALAYWLGRAGGLWAVTGMIAFVLLSLTGCVWIFRSTRKEPSSFDGYPFVAFIAIGIGALIALSRGFFEAANDQ